MFVSNFWFIYLLPIYFRFDPRVGRFEKTTQCLFVFVFVFF